jgi:hypothetical protein
MAEAAGAETNKLANAITAINGAFQIRNIASLLIGNSGNPAPSTWELATANPLRFDARRGQRLRAPFRVARDGFQLLHPFDRNVHAPTDVVYTSLRFGKTSVWKVPADGGEPVRIANLFVESPF